MLKASVFSNREKLGFIRLLYEYTRKGLSWIMARDDYLGRESARLMLRLALRSGSEVSLQSIRMFAQIGLGLTAELNHK